MSPMIHPALAFDDNTPRGLLATSTMAQTTSTRVPSPNMKRRPVMGPLELVARLGLVRLLRTPHGLHHQFDRPMF